MLRQTCPTGSIKLRPKPSEAAWCIRSQIPKLTLAWTIDLYTGTVAVAVASVSRTKPMTFEHIMQSWKSGLLHLKSIFLYARIEILANKCRHRRESDRHTRRSRKQYDIENGHK